MTDKLSLPIPPYPFRQGMQWEMNKDCIFIFDEGKPVMAISISEVVGALKKMNTAPVQDSSSLT